MSLPIDHVLPELADALSEAGRAVLEAPPGAGKTTGVPLALLRDGRFEGRIIMLEPRRLAARAAAERMADLLGERVGDRVGFRIRGARKIGPQTRIEVVTEGVFTAMIQRDPDLPGIGTVIFDEFHERALQADLGLALAWEVRQALRPDLRIVVMSATLDAAPVAGLMDDAPRITSAGRAFAVTTHWRDAPPPKGQSLPRQMQDLILKALEAAEGGILVFLPGQREIEETAGLLRPHLDKEVALHVLYGTLPAAPQRAAITPEPDGRRKLVLATSIAETSLTIADISMVIDSGLARRPRFDPGTGMSRLATEPVSRAEADQRRGRAGRVQAGQCWRNWMKAAEGALPAFAPPEIERADLSDLALQLALWGGADALRFLNPPPQAALAQARDLLVQLGALDSQGRITDHGRSLGRVPVHPRLAKMVLDGGRTGAELAALLSEADPTPSAGADLSLRLRALKSGDRAYGAIKAQARRLASFTGDTPSNYSAAEALALAYPDRLAQRRPGSQPSYLLTGGRGARLKPEDSLAADPYLVVCDLDAAGREARIHRALAITEAELRAVSAERIAWQDVCRWSERHRRVETLRQESLGAVVLNEVPWLDVPDEAVTKAVIEGIRRLGLSCLKWTDRTKRLRARIAFAGLADMSDEALTGGLEHWAAPYLIGRKSAEDLRKWDPFEALSASLSWPERNELDRVAPETWRSPLGRGVAIAYGPEGPEVSVRLQEVFGVTEHPRLGPDRLALRFVLLSPAGRSIQITEDLPGFWQGSYGDVRKDMRARYPKHPWPEDPSEAAPTLRAKPRGS
ncbi:MAG: ATP-dependent helicase HrpB [Pseudomonadota bacterium]